MTQAASKIISLTMLPTLITAPMVDHAYAKPPTTPHYESFPSSGSNPLDFFVTTVTGSHYTFNALTRIKSAMVSDSAASEFDIKIYSTMGYVAEWVKTDLENKIDSIRADDGSLISDSVRSDVKLFLQKCMFVAEHVQLYLDEDVLTLQWRNDTRGIMVIFTGDGSATFSIKESGGFYATNGRDFQLTELLPTELKDALATMIAS